MSVMKKLSTILIKILIVFFICQLVIIPESEAKTLSEIIKEANDFIEDGKNPEIEEGKKDGNDASIDNEKLRETTSLIYNTLLALGIVFSVIIGAILGIQLMWGSIEQQVKAKEMLMPYVAGCIVTFGAFGIWQLCVTIFSRL